MVADNLLKSYGLVFLSKMLKEKQIEIIGKAKYNDVTGTAINITMVLDNTKISGKLVISGQIEQDLLDLVKKI